MMDFHALIDKHYGFGGIMEKIEAGLDLAGKDANSLTVDDLAPIDEFHTRGRESTLEVAELTSIKASDLVLDVGCGLGGTARYLAEQYKCNVVGIDLTEEYISVGKKLTELVGLSDRVELYHGSALEIPYEDERYDIVWTDVEDTRDVAICEFSYQAKSWQRSRTLKAMRSVKEYVEVSYLGEIKTVPVYQYVCYVSSYDVDAIELHELYKQRSTSETWIEQVKGHTMAGNTLTDDFWANDILWQLSVFAYNISVMMRQKKDKYKRQEHRSFIEWFISVPAKITRSGHQIELKMYEHHFYKDAWEELDRLIEAA